MRHRLCIGISLFVLALHGSAWAAEDYLQNCPLKKGDQLSAIKDFYKISAEPKALEKPSPGNSSYAYTFLEYGVVLYLDENKRVQALRFERPFAGHVDGVAVGDEKSQLPNEPFKKVAGFADAEVIEARAKHKREIIDGLPNPAPREQVLKAFAAIEELNAQPFSASSGWIYKSYDGAMVRYDIGSISNRVQTILTERGTALQGAKVGSLTQQSVQEFFHHGDQLYNASKLDEYMVRFAENYTIKVNDKLITQGKRARQQEVFEILYKEYPHLAETVVHSAAIADDGQSAIVKLTETDRYRKRIGGIGTILQEKRPMEHNFAVIDDATVRLALVGGVIKIARMDIDKREITENAGK